MSRINLDGGEITIIRALGFAGTPMTGNELKGRVGRMRAEDLTGCLQTLIGLGYVTATPDLDEAEDMESISFAVNTGYAKALKETIDPPKEPTRRVRRQ